MSRYNVLERFKDTIIEQSLIFRGARVLMALSGGADSAVALDMLLRIKDEYSLTIEAVHINHMIRETAKRDENFCAALCEKYGVKIHIRRIDIPKLARERKIGLEECGRYERYRAFSEIMSERGLDLCVTAHNSNDNAETIVANLIRGASVRGLSGIPYRRGDFIRPLLDIKKSDIIRYAEQRGLEYMTDETNDDINYTRNFIRREIIPKMERINPSLVDTVSKNSRIFRYDEEYLSNAAKEAMAHAEFFGTYIKLKNDKLAKLSWAVLSRVIYLSCLAVSGDTPDNTAIMRAISAIRRGVNATETLFGGVSLEISYGFAHFIKASAPKLYDIPLSAGEEVLINQAGIKISCDIVPYGENNSKKFNGFIYMDYDTINYNTHFTPRREGDTFKPARGSGSRSVKRFMQDIKLARHLRAYAPLLRCGDEILWVYGSDRVASGHEVSDKTRRVLRLKISKIYNEDRIK